MSREALERALTASDSDQKAANIDEAARWLTLAIDVEQIWDHLATDESTKKPNPERSRV
jgi:hypothetical protein